MMNKKNGRKHAKPNNEEEPSLLVAWRSGIIWHMLNNQSSNVHRTTVSIILFHWWLYGTGQSCYVTKTLLLLLLKSFWALVHQGLCLPLSFFFSFSLWVYIQAYTYTYKFISILMNIHTRHTAVHTHTHSLSPVFTHIITCPPPSAPNTPICLISVQQEGFPSPRSPRSPRSRSPAPTPNSPAGPLISGWGPISAVSQVCLYGWTEERYTWLTFAIVFVWKEERHSCLIWAEDCLSTLHGAWTIAVTPLYKILLVLIA